MRFLLATEFAKGQLSAAIESAICNRFTFRAATCVVLRPANNSTVAILIRGPSSMADFRFFGRRSAWRPCRRPLAGGRGAGSAWAGAAGFGCFGSPFGVAGSSGGGPCWLAWASCVRCFFCAGWSGFVPWMPWTGGSFLICSAHHSGGFLGAPPCSAFGGSGAAGAASRWVCLLFSACRWPPPFGGAGEGGPGGLVQSFETFFPLCSLAGWSPMQTSVSEIMTLHRWRCLHSVLVQLL